VLSSRGVDVRLITHAEESCPVSVGFECDREVSRGGPGPLVAVEP
jgi:hypothetical protein